MKIGATLLIDNYGHPVANTTVAWHTRMFDRLVCVANCPSLEFHDHLKSLARAYPNFKYLGPDTTPFDPIGYHCRVVNRMVESLRDMDFVIHLDDDEFYTGPVRQVLEATTADVVYQGGSCFYETSLDAPDSNPVRRMTYRDPDGFPYQYAKAMHRLTGFKSTCPGNHQVNWHGGNPKVFISDKIKIYHYSHRVKALRPGHLPKDLEFIKTNGLIQDTSLIELFTKENIPL